MAGTIRNPVEWSADQLRQAAFGVSAAGRAFAHVPETLHSSAPTVRRINSADVWRSIERGAADFVACRTDVIFLCAFYPIVGLVLARMTFGSGMIQLVFPLIAGFALLGPLAAVGLLEMSRRLELGETVTWATAFRVARSPSFPAIVMLGLLTLAIFLLWLAAAALIYRITLGPRLPASPYDFAHAVLFTARGWAMIGLGFSVGFVFAALALATGLVSFALLLDRDAGIDTAIATSLRVAAANPRTVALWGVTTAGGLALGLAPLLLGLPIVFPVLGHATWHFYRAAVQPGDL